MRNEVCRGSRLPDARVRRPLLRRAPGQFITQPRVFFFEHLLTVHVLITLLPAVLREHEEEYDAYDDRNNEGADEKDDKHRERNHHDRTPASVRRM